MTVQIVQRGNRPSVQVAVKQPDGSARDLTGATNLKIKLRPAAARSGGKTYTATLSGAAANGVLITDAVAAADLTALGVWQAQAFYTLDGKDWHTTPVDIFEVRENLA